MCCARSSRDTSRYRANFLAESKDISAPANARESIMTCTPEPAASLRKLGRSSGFISAIRLWIYGGKLEPQEFLAKGSLMFHHRMCGAYAVVELIGPAREDSNFRPHGS